MPLHEHLVELTAKRLIACRQCRTPADMSLGTSPVRLICPGCHQTLGSWETTTMAIADITAFVSAKR